MERNTAPFHLWDNQREVPIPQLEVDEDENEIFTDPTQAEVENQMIMYEDFYSYLTHNTKRGLIEQRWDGGNEARGERRDTSFEI